MKLTIVFIGLIVQVNQSGLLNTAVLPSGGAGHPHEARLEIRLADIENPHASLKANGLGYAIIDLKDVHVTVGGTKGWFSRMTKELQQALPPLRELDPDCRLRKEVRERKPTKDLQAFVDFRGGDRTVDNYLPRALTFTRIGWEDRCVACGVTYIADLRGEYATLTLEGHDAVQEIRLKPGAEIFVKNMPSKPMENHFELLYGVYEGCSQAPIPLPQTKKCKEEDLCQTGVIRGGGPTAPGADCTGGNG